MVEGMIGKVHDHIINELDTNTRTDLVFVLTGIIFNLIILGANSGIAAGGRPGKQRAYFYHVHTGCSSDSDKSDCRARFD